MDFRVILREATRPEHDHLDAMFSALDIAEKDGFARFIQVHLTCFDQMAQAAELGSFARKLLRQMVGALSCDLQTLGESPEQGGEKLRGQIDPLAIDYLVAGSRLGSQVLCKRWSASADPVVRRSDRYFGLQSETAFWKATCTSLAAISPDSPRAKAVTEDARHLFGYFSTVFENLDAKKAMSV